MSLQKSEITVPGLVKTFKVPGNVSKREFWKKLERQEVWRVKGEEIPALTYDAILSMYPELEYSRWWDDGTQDTFLSVFFSTPTSALGTYVMGQFFGVSAWRVGLRERFGGEGVFEMFRKFAEPCTGQQKNLLTALVTVAQSEIPLQPLPLYEPGGKAERSELAVRASTQRAWLHARKALELPGEHLPMTQGKRRHVIIVGSRMGLDSGLWHEQFEDFLRIFHPHSQVDYWDPLDEASSKKEGTLIVRHHREKFSEGRQRKMVEDDILVDDAQTGSEIKAWEYKKLPRVYSLKKRGTIMFGIAEYRFFSHSSPSLHENGYSLCQCHSCRAVAFIADVYGGMEVWDKVRSLIARFGQVCSAEKVLKMSYIAQTAIRRDQQGIFVPAHEARLKEILPPVNSEVPSVLQKIVTGKSGIVLAYLSELQMLQFKRKGVPEFAVVDKERELEEVGYVPIVISKSALVLPGYAGPDSKAAEKGWMVYTRHRVAPRVKKRVKL